MYPFARLSLKLLQARFQPPLTPDDTHVCHVTCMPWDIDIFGELNNGITLSLYDLARLPFGMRVGLLKALRDNGWGLTMAGASVRYRRRVRMFQRVEVRTRVVGLDDRFMYLQQSMWRKGEATSSILYRSAVTDKNGIVPTQKVAKALGAEDWQFEMPDWVKAWIAAEDQRIWPPEI